MKKNRLLIVILALVLLCGCGSKETGNGKKATEGLVFTQEDGCYAVTGYHGTDVDVVIPDTYNDVPVTIIAEEAFADSEIQTIKMGSNIEVIELNAFRDATLLRRVELNSSLKQIGHKRTYSDTLDGAFTGCISLETVDIPEDSALELICPGTFSHCEKLANIELPGSLREIGEQAFKKCLSLKSITIPASVEKVGVWVFRGFTSEQKIVIMGSTEQWTKNWNEYCEAEIEYKG